MGVRKVRCEVVWGWGNAGAWKLCLDSAVRTWVSIPPPAKNSLSVFDWGPLLNFSFYLSIYDIELALVG